MKYLVGFALALLMTAVPMHGQAAAHQKLPVTTPEERAFIISASTDLENDPMGQKAAGERTRLLFLLLERSDLNVSACMTLLADVPKGDKDNYPILIQVLYSSARYAVQHNGGDAASLDQQVAGVEGALRVYEKFLLARPEDRGARLDAVVRLRDDGKLRAYVAQRDTSCS
jgi:hypothetical protein